ncbi:hypothetical protein CR513_31501, partial [Mucuna pruriens]
MDMLDLDLNFIFHYLSINMFVKLVRFMGDQVHHMVESVKEVNDCINYTNLNKHYPKDSYPLPNIDRLIGKNLEVYDDNMIVKNTKIESHLQDSIEVSEELCK